LPGPNHYDIAS